MTKDSKIKNYIRLTRLNQPIGIFLLFLPCLSGLLLAQKSIGLSLSEFLYFLCLFFTGSVIMRSAGCVINDLADYKFDKQVARTKDRPIASGEVKKFQAIAISSLLCILGLIILLQFHFLAICVGIVAMLLVLIYPFAKRFTNYPQLILGFTFNIGVLIGALALTNQIALADIFLYFGYIIWTVIYDTIYAYQDLKDDLATGIKSTAIKFQQYPKFILTSLSLMMLGAFFASGIFANLNPIYFSIITLSQIFLMIMIIKCDVREKSELSEFFKSSWIIGLGFSFAIFLG